MAACMRRETVSKRWSTELKTVRNELEGVYTALLTPFTEDASAINMDVLKATLDFQIASGIHGIVVAGSIGEFTALSEREWRDLVETTIGHVNGRIPVVVGSSAFTTDQAVERSRFAVKAGADGVMVLPLGFWRLTDEEVKAHYVAISDAVDVPIIVYNNPPKTGGVDISAHLFQSIAQSTRIRYIKETSYDVHRTQEIMSACGNDVVVLTGDDGAALPAFALGARGWVAGMSNYIPQLCVAIFEEFEKGNFAAAKEAHYKVVQIRAALESVGSYLGVARTATRIIGMPVGPSRRPLLPLSEEAEKAIAHTLRQVGVLTSKAA